MLRGLNRDVYYAMKALWSENQCFDCPGECEWSALGNLHLSGEVPFERYAASTACCCSHGCRVARALSEWRDDERGRRGLPIHPLLPHPLLPLCCCLHPLLPHVLHLHPPHMTSNPSCKWLSDSSPCYLLSVTVLSSLNHRAIFSQSPCYLLSITVLSSLKIY